MRIVLKTLFLMKHDLKRTGCRNGCSDCGSCKDHGTAQVYTQWMDQRGENTDAIDPMKDITRNVDKSCSSVRQIMHWTIDL